jgi:hypothetical protein
LREKIFKFFNEKKMFLGYSIERKTTYWGKNMEMENVAPSGMPGKTPLEPSQSKSVTISLHRQVKVSSISPEDLLLTVNKTAQEIDELKQVFLRSTTREDRAQIGPIIQRKIAELKYLVVSSQGTFQNLSPDQKRQFDTAMGTFFTAMRGFNQAVLQHQRMTEALQILGQIQAEIADHCKRPEKPREPLKEKVQEAERSLQAISRADLEKMTTQERQALETTLRSIFLNLHFLDINDPFDQLRSNLKAVEDAYVEEQKKVEEPQPSSEEALAAQGRGQEAQGASQPNAHTAVRTLSTAVAQLTSRKAKLRLDSGELKKTTRSVLPKNIMEALGRVGHSAESKKAGDKMVETLQAAVGQFDSLTMDERIQCLNALKDLENNAWFKGYLSHANGEMNTAFGNAKTALERKILDSFTSILQMAEGPDKQRSLTEAKSALEQLRRQHWSPELQTAYGKVLKAILESPMEVSLRGRFEGVDSSQRHAVSFDGQQPTPKAQGLITSTGKDRFWTDDVRTHYAEHKMTQEELEASVVFAQNPALSPERQQYLLAGRPQKKGRSVSKPEVNLDLPMSTKAGDERLLDRGGLITEQEASLGSGVVGFARVKLSSVITPHNSSVGQGVQLIGVMHDQEGSIQYIDAVVVSTAHLDFESEGKGDAHALALEDEAIEGSPSMPEALSEEERKKPELVAQYNKQLKQYQVFLYTKSGRIPSKKEVKSENILSYEDATSQIGELIRAGKSKEEIDKFLEGKCVRASNGSLYPLEMIFRKYLQTTKTVFGGLEGGCPQGYTYSIDPPNEFIKLFGKDPRLITRMQTLCLAYMKQEGASFTHLKALGLSTFIAPGGTRSQATVDTEGLELLQQVIPQTVDKSALFVRDPLDADFMVPAKEITLADGQTVPSGVYCMNDLRDPVVFYGSHERDASTEGRLAMMSNYAQIMGALRTPGMRMPLV